MRSTTSGARLFYALACVVACAMLAAVLAPNVEAAQGRGDNYRLRRAVTPGRINAHMKVLQEIALENDGNRASGFAGYDESAAYVARKLRGAGYKVTVQSFPFELFIENAPGQLEQTAPGAKTYTEGTDFTYMEFSGSGDVTAPVTNVDLMLPPGDEPSSSTSGCEEEDFDGFPAGNIALIQRGFCDFGLKAQNAADAGAAGAVIFNEGQEGRTDLLSGTLGAFRPGIPVFGTTFELGNDLAQIDGLELHMAADTTIESTTSSNVLAETRGGNPNKVVMAGGHLDSVQAGPGINDNGSGSMSVLEIALQRARLGIAPRNKLRFAFWGAEESGLIGSNYYVDNLVENHPNKLARIALYLNFDMVSSPNFARFIYDGDGSAFGIEGPPGSDQIEADFQKYWDVHQRANEETEFSGRSDYLAFILNGVASGGLFSGAEGVKTEEQEALYGGVAGLPYDPCYHQACDTYFNPNMQALNQFSNNMANIIAKYSKRLPEGIEQASSARKASAKSGEMTTKAIYRGSHAAR